MSFNQFSKDYLRFSKKERIATIILLLVIVVLIILPFFDFSPPKPKNTAADTAWMAAANRLTGTGGAATRTADDENLSALPFERSDDRYEARTAGRLFNFDPNTLGEAGWKELGLRARTIRTILNYRSKGGKFRKPDDLQKIYGLHSDEFERLKPFIVIAAAAPGYIPGNSYREGFASEEKPKYRPNIIDINTADTTAYKSLYGIGSKLAARIVNFRNKLGGFYSVEQVGETYGVPDSTFQKIKPLLKIELLTIKKIDLNVAGYDELNAHPYISSKLAYLIVKHRKDQGNFTSIGEVADLAVQTNDAFEKIRNYITVQ